MGVKDLWNILGPVAHKCALIDLQGKTVAIDLSCWVCEGQIIGERVEAQPRMYLRNVFFRTQLLLYMNIKPVFVLDGEAPSLKLSTMQKRNDKRFVQKNGDIINVEGLAAMNNGRRSRFRGILKNCRQMLELMGVTCLESVGEGEALCAQLNRDGIVDGVFSQDSDVFLYGARVVYRNLTIKAGTGTVEAYHMDDIEEKLNLNREKLIAMSLLCGCDYNQTGVHGIGKETAYNYLKYFEGDILSRLSSLRSDKTLQRYENEFSYCSKCCHPGKCNEHKKNGCLDCDSGKGCFENSLPTCYKNLDDGKKQMVSFELSVRKKSIKDESFPNIDTINEYLKFHQNYPDVDATLRKPNITQLCLFTRRMLEWPLDYSFEKILPLLTRWLLTGDNCIACTELVPVSLVKKRIVKGVPSIDVLWKVNDENLKAFLTLLTEDCKVLTAGLCATTEPKPLVAESFKELYEEFLEKTNKKPKVKKSQKKKAEKEVAIQSDPQPNGVLQSNEIDLSLLFLESLKLTESPPHSSSFFSLSSSPSLKNVPESFSSLELSEIDPSVSISSCFNNLSLPDTMEKENISILSDDTTVDYDISEILNDIVSRRQYY